MTNVILLFLCPATLNVPESGLSTETFSITFDEVNCGVLQPGSVKSRVFNDQNGKGEKNPGNNG